MSDEELMKTLGGVWNSAYGHWEFRFLEGRTMIFLNADEVSVLSERLKSRDQQIALAARERAEGIGAYIAASSLLSNVGYLLTHRSQGGLPEMTAEVIGDLYSDIKKILDENKRYMQPDAALKAQEKQ
jgi:hypothetical protein